ncbi:LysM peptidoglycan-binding domain-containing protein [Pyruvatibacter mobilis]|uniref:LysM peptidoglycan-binding domain-containing protein n=1 Tax=Pyruvatibacter mobilis TaxID=1712261 RepID=A0A845Q7B5_9HYPH|nr:LysM peptidoglycan-binding domain-containing protein [Pyruvatibacter mobilis]NBG94482.1 LysM peptidoglycan-binding domain-containing protein [Pyruvatibacter mobilis]GGD03289.1 hypothetical protein GCM10011587_03770 [Pyruvatibacter mobilis]
MLPFDHLIVHVTATPPSVDFNAGRIDADHRKKGYKKNGYHIVVLRDGKAEVHVKFGPDELQARMIDGARVRTFSEPGAHVGSSGRGWNKRSIGVVLVGGVDEDGNPENNATEAQLETLRMLIDALMEDFDIPLANVMGHRDLIAKAGKGGPKECPCFDVREWYTCGSTKPVEAQEDEPQEDTPEPEETPQRHTVVHGDTLWALANTYGLSVEDLMDLNGLKDDTIRIGQVLTVTV